MKYTLKRQAGLYKYRIRCYLGDDNGKVIILSRRVNMEYLFGGNCQ